MNKREFVSLTTADITHRSAYADVANIRIFPTLLLVLLALLGPYTLRAQSSHTAPTDRGPTSGGEPDSRSKIGCLPSTYQDVVERDLPPQFASTIIVAQQGLSADECVGWAMRLLSLNPDGRSFLFSKADTEASGRLRRLIFAALYYNAHRAVSGSAPLMGEPESKVLETHASSDPDVGASFEALLALREFHTAKEAALLRVRQARIPPGDRDPADTELDDLRLQHYMWYGETRLAPFAYVPPPPFTVVPVDKAIRVLAFGDFGEGSIINDPIAPSVGQIKAASAMRNYNRKYAFDFGITLGDNFYPNGLNTPDSPRWKLQWEDLYGAMGIKFYPVLGNHDYNDVDGPAAELAYTQRSKTWDFLAPYYTYTAGSAQFFAIDNIRLSAAELSWLDRELANSTAKWKIVYGHYNIYSPGFGDENDMITMLLPLLERHHVQIYMNGHDHTMGEVRTDSPVHFFTSGAGGADLTDPMPTYKKAVFVAKAFGFAVLEIDNSHVEVIFVDADGKEIYRSDIIQ
jgi:tartrate-resistant acid phosphatase type 5